jgi:two-component system, LytTR family, response regulator
MAAAERLCSQRLLDQFELIAFAPTSNRRVFMTLKVLIVDNERQERNSLVELCGQRDDVQIVGEAESGVDALRAADELCPDVMLVDVELPDMSGFDLLSATHAQTVPLSVIVTGGPDDAAAALAAGALDYLLKPVDAARLGQSLERAQHRCRSPRASVRIVPRLAPLHDFQAPPPSENKLRFLVGERQHRLYPLEVEKIDYIEAHGNYVTIRSGTCDYIRRDSIKRLAAYLADRGFMRIERSLLLNVRAVAYAQVANHGTFAFTLASGACIQSSSTYRDVILNVLPLVPLSRRKERGNLTRSAGK